jgi:hypothetical protein
MELSKNLADKYFSVGDAYNLESEISKKLTNSEEYQSLKKLISDVVTDILLEVFPNRVFLDLFKEYPKLFRNTNIVDICLSSLGILSDRTDYYTEDDDSVYLQGNIRVHANSYFPYKGYSIELTEEMIRKAPSSKVELLKEWASKYMHLGWLNKKEISDFKRQSDSIKTFGKLYRTNKDWYELIVKTHYQDDITYEPKEVTIKKEEDKNRFVASLNNLKAILEL